MDQMDNGGRGGDERAPDRAGAVEGTAPLARRSKKGKKKAALPQLNENDYVNVVPLPSEADLLEREWRPVQLSKTEKAGQAVLSTDNMSVTMRKGYRMVRATKGAHVGTWYYEIVLDHLGDTGHARLGWSTKRGDLQAPVGYDEHSLGYRDLEGCKVHRALREPYGEPYSQGDVVGCFLHMPEGGRSLEKTQADVVLYRSRPVLEYEPDPEPVALPGSLVAFTKNGALQGVAYRDITDGTYFPAASLYTDPSQTEGATVTFNFGPTFKFPPPNVEGCPPAQPVSELAGDPPIKEQPEQAQALTNGLANAMDKALSAPKSLQVQG